MKFIIIIFLFTATMLAQNNILNSYNRGTEVDSLLNKIKNDVYTKTQVYTKSEANVLFSGGGTHGWRYPATYGAVGDGVTNDMLALRQTFLTNNSLLTLQDTIMVQLEAGKTYYAGLEPVFFWMPSGSTRPRYIHIEGNGATIVTHDSSANYMFYLSGYTDTERTTGWTSIPNAYTRGDEKIKVATSISNITKKGDILWITTSADMGGVSQQPDWLINSNPKSEMVEVLRVSNDTLTLVGNLTESYEANDTTKIKIMDHAKVVIRNLKIEHRTPTALPCAETVHRAFDFRGLKHFLFDNVEVNGFPYLGLQVTHAIGGVVDNYKAKDLDECAVRGMNYGLVLTAVQDVVVQNSNIHGGRHAIDVGSSSWMLGRNVIISNNIVGVPQYLSTATITTHPGVRDILVTGNKVYGTITMRSTHNLIIGNIVHGYFDNGLGAGGAGISVHNAWNPDGAYNLIANNVIDAKIGAIQLLTGNVGSIKGNYVVTGNKIRASNFLRFDSYNASGYTQYVDNVVISNNIWEKGGSSNSPPIYINAAGADSLVVNNFVFENNTMGTPSKTVDGAIIIYGANTNIDIKKMIIRSNSFFINTMIDIKSGALVRYLEITGNLLDADNGVSGSTSPVLIGGTVTTLKHVSNTYMNLATSTSNVVSGTVTNWYRGLDILLNSTNWSLYGVTATNGWGISWVSD